MTKNNFSPYTNLFMVHTPNLLNETFINACRPADLAALRIPLNTFIAYLRSVADRAIELDDPILNKLMCEMTLFDCSDPESEGYQKGWIEIVNKRAEEQRKKEAAKQKRSPKRH